MRYFLSLAYRGTRYAGWQRQPNAMSVQETLETSVATLLRKPVALVGCGRTDAGVHALRFVAHFDYFNELPPTFENGLNSLLPDDIAVSGVLPVPADAHARFDAVERSYEYHISLSKDPFAVETSWFFPQGRHLDTEALLAVAALFPKYEAFAPFCKTDSGADHYRCRIVDARWDLKAEQDKLVFHISANRFLRGMVRLIVGACVLAGRGQLSPNDVRIALDAQSPLPKSLSVPPQGLFLTGIKYPFPMSRS